MILRKRILRCTRLALIGGLSTAAYLLILAAGSAPAKATETTLYSFTGGTDGATPQSRLIVDAKGALYGTTWSGGTSFQGLAGSGTVFKLTPPASGTGPWTETVLHAFPASYSDGVAPVGALILDASGALYGATSEGGLPGTGHGTVFKLTPPSSGAGPWTETILYSFNGPNEDGPGGGLIFDAQGALYGVTELGGTGNCNPGGGGCGTVYKLAPPSSGTGPWKKTVLYSFKNQADGHNLRGELVFNSYGALYGVTAGGGPSSMSGGTVFKLTPPASGKGNWTKTLLNAFNDQKNGMDPVGPLIFDAKGALYGSTLAGGPGSGGVVYKLTPRTSGPWGDHVLYTGLPLNTPYAPLILDAQGDLYGTSQTGSNIFKLAPPLSAGTAWTETTLHTFSDTFTCIKNSDGCGPMAGLTVDAKGVFYGTTAAGGSTNNGVVFKLQCNHWVGTGKARTCQSW